MHLMYCHNNAQMKSHYNNVVLVTVLETVYYWGPRKLPEARGAKDLEM